MKMKRYIIPFLTLAAVLSGCAVDELNSSLKDIKVEPSYVSLKPEGDSKEIILTATGNWSITNIPEWLTVEPASGSATDGQTVKLTALKAYEDLSVELHANVGASTQIILVKQSLGGQMEITSVKDFIESGVDGKVYTIQGIVGAVENTLYGNFYINDGTYEDGPGAYVYGMLDANGAEKNFLSLGIEEGDEIIISGPRLTYLPKYEIEKASLVKMVKKALLGADVKEYTLENEAGNLAAPVVVKGNEAKVSVPSDVDWVKFDGVEGSGEKTKILLSYTENTTALPRETEVTVTSSKEVDGTPQTSSLVLTLKQLPVLPDPTKISEIEFKEDIDGADLDYVAVEGTIAALTTGGFVIDDGSKAFVEVSDFNYREFKEGYKVKAVGYAEKKDAQTKVVVDYLEVIEKSEGYSHPENAVAITKDNVSGIAGENPAKYGYYKVSGFVSSDKSIVISGTSSTSYTVSAVSPVGTVDLKDYAGKYVTAYGYYTDNDSKKDIIKLVLTKVGTGEAADPFFEIFKSSDKIAWDEMTTKFQVLTNQSWTATLADDFGGTVSLSKTSGTGTGEISVIFKEKNSKYENQTVNVTVSAGELEPLSYKLTRTGKELALSAGSVLVTSAGQNIDIKVTASLFWKAEVKGEGATISKTEGKGTDVIVLTVPENKANEVKKYTVTVFEDRVSDASAESASIEISQRAANDKPSVVYSSVTSVTSGKEYLIYAEGGAMTMTMSGGKPYGYLNATPLDIVDGKITTFDAKCGFRFIENGKGYNIVSVNGGYYIYMSGNHTTFNWTKDDAQSSDKYYIWTVEPQDDGTVKITNTGSGRRIQFASVFGAYIEDEGVLPVLFEKQE